MRDNPKGDLSERWMHAAGCRRWFNVVRDTATHEIVAPTAWARSRRDDGDGWTIGGGAIDRSRAGVVHVRRTAT